MDTAHRQKNSRERDVDVRKSQHAENVGTFVNANAVKL